MARRAQMLGFRPLRYCSMNMMVMLLMIIIMMMESREAREAREIRSAMTIMMLVRQQPSNHTPRAYARPKAAPAQPLVTSYIHDIYTIWVRTHTNIHTHSHAVCSRPGSTLYEKFALENATNPLADTKNTPQTRKHARARLGLTARWRIHFFCVACVHVCVPTASLLDA